MEQKLVTMVPRWKIFIPSCTIHCKILAKARIKPMVQHLVMASTCVVRTNETNLPMFRGLACCQGFLQEWHGVAA